MTSDLLPEPIPRQSHRRRRLLGQSVVEFALLLPLFLAFVGATVDVARLFQTWISLEGATRDAAEYAATATTDSATALTQARRVLCNQSRGLSGFQPGPGSPPASIDACLSPSVTIVSFTRSTTAAGATTTYPIASVTVRATLNFQTLFTYPFITNNRNWTMTSTQSYSIVQGR